MRLRLESAPAFTQTLISSARVLLRPWTRIYSVFSYGVRQSAARDVHPNRHHCRRTSSNPGCRKEPQVGTFLLRVNTRADSKQDEPHDRVRRSARRVPDATQLRSEQCSNRTGRQRALPDWNLGKDECVLVWVSSRLPFPTLSHTFPVVSQIVAQAELTFSGGLVTNVTDNGCA